jgi:hypothetical protein
MFEDCNRIEDRRKSSFDFRKNKVNNRKKLRRRIDKINYSIYYIIVVLLLAILAFWCFAAFHDIFLGGM